MYCRTIYSIKKNTGFTLIEVIVSLILAGILGAMIFAFMGSRVMSSANPVILTQNGTYLSTIMEKMTSDYNYQMSRAAKNNWSPSTGLSYFVANVGTEGASRTYYSDAFHPYTVLENHKISFTTTSPSSETTDVTGKICKVTIQYRGLSTTAFFTE